jgi:hypothetical protein
MPLARYFSFVGGVLLTLLFILDAYLPKIPVREKATANLPIIRIHSERKWPERIVFDTSAPIPVQSCNAGTGSQGDTRRRISRRRGRGSLAGLVRVPGEGVNRARRQRATTGLAR